MIFLNAIFNFLDIVFLYIFNEFLIKRIFIPKNIKKEDLY